jgi:outer membrane protein insertion porin family
MQMKESCLFVVMVFLLSSFFGAASAQVASPGETAGAVIDSIEVTGNVSLSRSEILSKVRSRVGQLFDPAVAEEDAKRIAGLAGVELGYYNVERVGEKIRVTFVVIEENIVRSIVFIGNREYKAKKLRSELDSKMGEYFDRVMAEGDRNNLLEFYRKNGFPFVKVSLDAGKLDEGQLVFTIEEGPRVKIDSVKFSGNKALKTSELKKVVKIKKTKWLVLPAYYVKEYAEKDITHLQNIYYDRGFLNNRVQLIPQFNEDRSAVGLVFEIEEGTAYTVSKIIITGNTHFDEQDLDAKLKLKQGRTYNKRNADTDVEQLLKMYGETGFINASVEHKEEFVSSNQVNVEYEIKEGGRFRIGLIDIAGNQETQDKVVRRVLDEYDFKPGLWYNADIARGDGKGELEKRIRRMVFTESATITAMGEAPDHRDALVSVTEGQTGMLMVGAGVASDYGAFGQFVFEQKNFDITDRPEGLKDLMTGSAFKGGGQRLRIELRPGTELSEYSVNFTEPYLQNRPISLDLVGLSRDWERESYDENRLRGYVGLEKRYRNHWRRSLSVRVDNVEVDSIDFDAPQEIKDVKGSNGLVGVKVGFRRELTDDEYYPTKGHAYRGNYEQVAGDHTFGVVSGTYVRYKTLAVDLADRKTVLSTKLHGATVVGDAPPFEKFYAGGSQSIRGFDFRGVSTRGLQTNVANPQKKEPIGSDWIILGSAEIAVPVVSDNLSLLLFVDSGLIDTGGYRASVGTGIQLLLPQWFGPVPMRLEVATPFIKDGEDDTQVFSFSVGRLF